MNIHKTLLPVKPFSAAKETAARDRSPELSRLLASERIVAIDVGARGGFTKDLSFIAAAVDGIGLEPDRGECERLNAAAAKDPGGLRSLRYLPTGLGAPAGARTLNLYKQRGCSSMLAADADFAALFARDDYFVLEDQIEIAVEPLDDAARDYHFDDAHFMKIDIQGAELEVFRSGPKLLESLLGIRTEIEFAPLYKDQPLFADVDAELRSKGFVLASFPECHSWRRGTRIRGDKPAHGPVPLSQAQLIHGDALYFRSPEAMPRATAADRDQLIRLALIAFAHGHVDLSASIFATREISQHLENLAVRAPALIAELGAMHAARRRAQMRASMLDTLRALLR